MSVQEFLDRIQDVMDTYALRPTQKIDTLLQAIEEIEETEGEDEDADDGE